MTMIESGPHCAAPGACAVRPRMAVWLFLTVLAFATAWSGCAGDTPGTTVAGADSESDEGAAIDGASGFGGACKSDFDCESPLVCAIAAGFTSGRCVECATPDGCGPGEVCRAGQCVPGGSATTGGPADGATEGATDSATGGDTGDTGDTDTSGTTGPDTGGTTGASDTAGTDATDDTTGTTDTTETAGTTGSGDATDTTGTSDTTGGTDTGTTACTSDSDCASTPQTPRCQGFSGQCVQCLTAIDCPSGQVCGPFATCVADTDPACASDAECRGTPATPLCSPFTRTCVECLSVADCGAGEICADNVCADDPTTCATSAECQAPTPACVDGLCRPCAQDTDCTGGLVCKTVNNTCVTCVSDANCPGGQRCNTIKNTCVTCVEDADCPATACDTVTNQCVECVSDANCPGERCKTATKTCVQCLASSDCPSATPNCDTVTNTCKACSKDADCPSNRCRNQTCVACVVKGDCGQGFDCKDFTCVPITPECSPTKTCPFGQYCVSGDCTNCTTNAACNGDICDPRTWTCRSCSVLSSVQGTQGDSCSSDTDCLYPAFLCASGRCRQTCKTSLDCCDDSQNLLCSGNSNGRGFCR
jgi:Cys-rich repeat protein